LPEEHINQVIYAGDQGVSAGLGDLGGEAMADLPEGAQPEVGVAVFAAAHAHASQGVAEHLPAGSECPLDVAYQSGLSGPEAGLPEDRS
jgi:hypothetical protein